MEGTAAAVPLAVSGPRHHGPMRAARLIKMVLLLQSRPSMTAAELARELEVSERTSPGTRRRCRRRGFRCTRTGGGRAGTG